MFFVNFLRVRRAGSYRSYVKNKQTNKKKHYSIASNLRLDFIASLRMSQHPYHHRRLTRAQQVQQRRADVIPHDTFLNVCRQSAECPDRTQDAQTNCPKHLESWEELQEQSQQIRSCSVPTTTRLLSPSCEDTHVLGRRQ